MFEVLTNGNISHRCATYIALVTLSCLVCFAQNQTLNPVQQFESIADSLLSPSMSEASESNGVQLPCWRQPAGCAAHLSQVSLPERCASIRLVANSNRVICVPFPPSRSSSIPLSSSSSFPFFSSRPATSAMLRSDSESSIEKLLDSIEDKRQINRDSTNWDLLEGGPLVDSNNFVAAKSNNPTSDDDENNSNEECNESGDFYGNANKLVTNNCKGRTYSNPNIEAVNNIGQQQGGGGIGEQKRDRQRELTTRAWQSFQQLKEKQRQKNANQYQQNSRQTGGGQSSYRIAGGTNADEMPVDRYIELPQMNKQQLSSSSISMPIVMTEPSSSSSPSLSTEPASKVPIILVKLTNTNNQRRTETTQPSQTALRNSNYNHQVNYYSRKPSPIRLHRSETAMLNGTTGSFVPKSQAVDLDGGAEPTLVTTNQTMGVNNMVSPEIQIIRGVIDEDGGRVESPLYCSPRRYTFRASKSDGFGNKCSGYVFATICYGGCDTGEIADWLFPHKKSTHKVCTHGVRIRRRVILDECTSDDVDPSLREYHYVDAGSCACRKCNSADTTCLGSITRPTLPTAWPQTSGLNAYQI